MNPSPHSLDSLFAPKSIAVVGASNTLGKIGAMPIQLLKKQGYAGTIYPINPKESTVQDLTAYASLDAVPTDSIDLVILAIPAKQVYQTLKNSPIGRIRHAVIFSSGFAELGELGTQEQNKLNELAQARGIRLLGPNCLGFINVNQHVFATFTPAAAQPVAADGKVAIISQSGAFGAYAYSIAAQRNVSLSFWISTGNECNVSVADCIHWLVNDPNTNVIMAYLEGCQDGEALKQALAAAALAGKPVVITKVGRTQAGATAAASHTAALAGNDAVFDALFEQYGALRAYSIEEFFNLGHALSIWSTRPQKNTLGILTVSGGVGALMADDAEEAKLELPAPSLATQQRLLEQVPFACANNPIDITGQIVAEPDILINTAENLLESQQYGALVLFLAAAGNTDFLWPHIVHLAELAHQKYPTIPLAICTLLSAERRKQLEQLNCMVFADPSTAVQVIAKTQAKHITLPSYQAAKASSLNLASYSAKQLNEADSLALLKAAGIRTIEHQLAHSKQEAVAIARSFAGPVVMKIVSCDLPHKSDLGGVRLGITGDEAVAATYEDLIQTIRQAQPHSQIDGVLIAPMAAKGVECILGSYTDPTFGPVILFGLGGVFVEALKDVRLRLAPFDKAEALRLIHEIQGIDLLYGTRGTTACDLELLADQLAALSDLAWQEKDNILSIDINPFLINATENDSYALDALVLLA